MHRIALLPLLLAACAPSPNEDGPLNQAFSQAAADWEVPRDLLVSIAWTETRLAQQLPRDYHHAPPAVGIMGLRLDGQPGVEQAAKLAHLNAELVEEQLEANVQAAAAWLHDRARDRHERTREKVDTLQEWYPVVAEYSGASDPAVAEGFAYEVFRNLEWGIFHETPDGEYIEVAPRDMPWFEQRVATSGSGLVDQFIPADPANYSDYSRGPEDIDYVIIHVTQGSYSGAISWFQNPAAQASAHYVVRSSDGEITQMVDEEDVAWHAGNWEYNLHSVGVEHEGYVEDPDTWFTDAMYRSSAALVADICDRNGIPKDRDHIIGHVEVPGATHTDPGDGWDWDYYMSLVTGSNDSLPFDPDWDGARGGRFEATVSSAGLGVSDTCSGPISGQVSGGNVYLTATCRLDRYGDRAGDVAITWTGSITGNQVDGRIVVDSYTDPWTGEVRTDGTIVAQMSGSKDLGGDVGVLSYEASIEATPQ